MDGFGGRQFNGPGGCSIKLIREVCMFNPMGMKCSWDLLVDIIQVSCPTTRAGVSLQIWSVV